MDLQAGMHMPGPQWQWGRLREVGRLEGCLGKSQGHMLMELGVGWGVQQGKVTIRFIASETGIVRKFAFERSFCN